MPDGSILMHLDRPYDPKQAHEYYLRTRKLKGRKPGQVHPKVAHLAKSLAGKSDKQIKAEIAKAEPHDAQIMTTLLSNRQRLHGKKSGPKTVSPEVQRQKQAAARRVGTIRTELADLNNRLKEALAKANKSEAKKKRGPTAADKADKARDAKKYRDKHKQKLESKRKTASSKDKASGKSKADTVTSLKKEIAETKGRLARAIAKEKALG